MTDTVHWGTPEKSLIGFQQLERLTDPKHFETTTPRPDKLEDFASVIENLIVPRLVMAHAPSQSQSEIRERHHPQHDDVLEFAELTTREDPALATAYVQRLLDKGMLIEDLFLKVMAPAARYLGERWVHDTCSFVEVTLGVARMHRLLREFNGVPDHLWSSAGVGHSALLLPTPGEQHTFGLRLVQEFMLREGWSVINHPVENERALRKLMKAHYFDVAGLSLSGETLIDNLVSAIRLIRAESRNPHIKIIVGGQIFTERPELLKLSGADATATDAPTAVKLANNWVSHHVVMR
jgi:MerR family transcriptional regulator, light-induced transcriptional regulator